MNPLWTISALAERAVALLVAERGWGGHTAEPEAAAAEPAMLGTAAFTTQTMAPGPGGLL